jgi:CubicO group peptidase (beta-lactamase class C family)
MLAWSVGAGAAAFAHRSSWAEVLKREGVSGAVEPALEPAFEALDAFVPRHLKEQGLPGLTHALASREATLRTATYGLREVKTGEPLTPHHLLTHSSGLPGAGVTFPLGESRPLWTSHAPGETFHYCNLGYDLLGMLVETVDGRRLSEALRARIFGRLGMTASEPIIINAMRHRLPTGYWPLRDDQPLGRGGALVEAPNVTFDGGAGCIASTPATWRSTCACS